MRDPRGSLTSQQDRIVGLLMEGRVTDEITQACGFSAETLKRHLQNIFNKLGCGSRPELMACVHQYEVWLLRSAVMDLQKGLKELSLPVPRYEITQPWEVACSACKAMPNAACIRVPGARREGSFHVLRVAAAQRASRLAHLLEECA